MGGPYQDYRGLAIRQQIETVSDESRLLADYSERVGVDDHVGVPRGWIIHDYVLELLECDSA